MFMNRERVKFIKAMYPKGTRIKLISMEDPWSPVEPGTCGTVDAVDSIGQIHMTWDNGRTLALIYGEDRFTVLQEGM